ncbi:hypothetical protein P7C70_g1469, partial [Phenoliferia sp. Uapishka_3]
MFPNKCLTITIPNKPPSRSTSTEPPAFGIPSYSYRALRRPIPDRHKVTPAHFLNPSTTDLSLHPVTSKIQALSARSSFSSLSADSNTQEHVVDIDISPFETSTSHQNRPFQKEPNHTSLGIPPPSNLTPPRRGSASSSSSSYHGHNSLPPSPTGTFLSTSTGAFSNPTPNPSNDPFSSISHPNDSSFTNSSHAPPPLQQLHRPRAESESSINSSRTRVNTHAWFSSPPQAQSQARRRSSGGELPSYTRRPSVADHVSRGHAEIEADRLKRLYLCPWERLSPRTFRKLKAQEGGIVEEKQEVKSREVEEREREKAKKKVVVVGVAVLVLLLLADLLVLNIRLFSRED